jgi:hypothetical protein
MMGQASSNQQNQGRDELIKKMSSLPLAGQYTHPHSSNQPTTHETDVKMSKTVQKKNSSWSAEEECGQSCKSCEEGQADSERQSVLGFDGRVTGRTDMVPWKHPPLRR